MPAAVLGYFGADVIKVEPPGAGDALRSLRMADKSGTSLWWRSYVSHLVCLSLTAHGRQVRDFPLVALISESHCVPISAACAAVLTVGSNSRHHLLIGAANHLLPRPLLASDCLVGCAMMRP